jgi:hypothetical protein
MPGRLAPGHPLLVPEGKRIKLSTAGAIISGRSTRQLRNLEIGVERMSVNGFHLRVTNKARTSVDLVPWGGVRQHAVEAVRAHLADGCNGSRLHAMADEFGVGILNEIVTLTEAMLVA